MDDKAKLLIQPPCSVVALVDVEHDRLDAAGFQGCNDGAQHAAACPTPTQIGPRVHVADGSDAGAEIYNMGATDGDQLTRCIFHAVKNTGLDLTWNERIRRKRSTVGK